MPEHILKGCTTKPLSGYLKGLAVLKLLTEQKDPSASGYWHEDVCCLITALSHDDLVRFFCCEYKPTPVITPWNGGSGFYSGDSHEGLDAITGSQDSRFDEYRDVINSVKNWPEWSGELETCHDVLEETGRMLAKLKPGGKMLELAALKEQIERELGNCGLTGTENPLHLKLDVIAGDNRYKLLRDMLKKARSKLNAEVRSNHKHTILALCRNRLPESVLPWMDAVGAVRADGTYSFHQLLGSGGNDARLDFGNNFMRSVTRLLIGKDKHRSNAFLVSSLFGTLTDKLPENKLGQFNPGRAGGYNQGMGIEKKDFKANPWDYVLTIEGSLLFASSVARRHGYNKGSRVPCPFSVKFSPVGFASNEYTESSGRDMELWLPLWSRQAGYAELQYLFSEGRTTLGRNQALTGIEFSRAIGSLGVERGIDAFERYGFLKRRGDNRIALPSGNFSVQLKPALEILDELDPVLRSLDIFISGFKVLPVSYLQARRQIDAALFDCSINPDPDRFVRLVRAIGRMERKLALQDHDSFCKPSFVKPQCNLSPGWVFKCDDGGVETRIAAALSSVHRTERVGSIRHTMAGVASGRGWIRAKNDAQQHWIGRDLSERLCNAVFYRILYAQRKSVEQIPLQAVLKLNPHDVMPFLKSDTDDTKIEELLWGFALINWNTKGINTDFSHWRSSRSTYMLSRTWSLFKLLFTPDAIKGNSPDRILGIASALRAGRLDEAVHKTLHQLRYLGVSPYPVTYTEHFHPERLLSSMMVPINDVSTFEEFVISRQFEKGEFNV